LREDRTSGYTTKQQSAGRNVAAVRRMNFVLTAHCKGRIVIVKLGPNDAANDKAQQTKQAAKIKETAAKKSHPDLLEACMMAQLQKDLGTMLAAGTSSARQRCGTSKFLAVSAPERIVGYSECAGVNRHVVGDARALRERRKRLYPDL